MSKQDYTTLSNSMDRIISIWIVALLIVLGIESHAIRTQQIGDA